MVAKYGDVAYRRWEVFLAWSQYCSNMGSSTVMMITATKQGGKDTARRIETQQHLVPKF